MTSSNKEIFTWVNPIIIGNIAYIFYKDYKKYWDLRFPENVGDEILKIFPISEINESIDQEVMDTIAAYSLTRLRKRF